MDTHDRELLINRENLEFAKDRAKTNETLRAFYQSILIKFVRDVDLLKDQPESLAKFYKINEYSHEVSDQQFYMQLLKDIDFKQKMNEFANKHVGTNLHVEQLSKMLDEIGLNATEEGDDNSDLLAAAVRSPSPGKKTKSQQKKGGSPTFAIMPKNGGVSLEMDKLMKEKLQLLLKNSIAGCLEPPVATLESGQPDYEKVECADPEFVVKEDGKLKLSKTNAQGKSPRRPPGEKSGSSKGANPRGVGKRGKS